MASDRMMGKKFDSNHFLDSKLIQGKTRNAARTATIFSAPGGSSVSENDNCPSDMMSIRSAPMRRLLPSPARNSK